MKFFLQILTAAALFASFEVSAVTAVAQQITGTPGSPSAVKSAECPELTMWRSNGSEAKHERNEP